MSRPWRRSPTSATASTSRSIRSSTACSPPAARLRGAARPGPLDGRDANAGASRQAPRPPGSIAVCGDADDRSERQPGSNVGLYTAYAYAVLYPILSGVRDGRRAALVDAIMYAESIAITQAFTHRHEDRRAASPPDRLRESAATARPLAAARDTDLQLSFFSGHASTTGAISATATYLAFMRSGPRRGAAVDHARGGHGADGLRQLRARSLGEHFPTDVIMGSLAGAGIGVLVPHFHHRPSLRGEELLRAAGLDWPAADRGWDGRRHARRAILALAPRSVVGVTSDAAFGEASILLSHPIRIVSSRCIGQAPGLHLHLVLGTRRTSRKGGVELRRVRRHRAGQADVVGDLVTPLLDA